MRVPMDLPVAPMLARMVDRIPEADAVAGGYAYEPKWDGLRCLILRDHDQVEMLSRMNKSLTRHFPEVVARILATLPERCVVDAEVILRRGQPPHQQLDWDALSQRLHLSSRRVQQLSRRQPAELVCFDLLGLGNENLMDHEFGQRRQRLEQVFSTIDPSSGVHLTASSSDVELARQWFATFEGAGLDGVMVKALAGRYEPGHRSMLKVKHRRTADAVVVGYRLQSRGHGIGSLLLGLYDARGRVLPVGQVSALRPATRLRLLDELAPLVAPPDEGVTLPPSGPRVRLVDAQARQVALRPELVVEVAFNQLEQRRFRHAVNLVRWRPDRDPRSCTFDQLELATSYDLLDVLR